ncbi:MAG: hypothetical protein M3O50_17200 [Myxococcota bacterium]|nr:hypothetical protein [Myxococcota bacterium]
MLRATHEMAFEARHACSPGALVVVACLVALERALLLEHPLLHAPPSADDPLVRSRARVVLRRASRLRRALRVYRGVVDAIAGEPDQDDERL